MLGLTQDPSPHGLNSKGGGPLQDTLNQVGGNDNMQLSSMSSGSIVPGLNSDFFNKDKQQAAKEDEDESDEEESLKTIKGRNHSAAKEMETLLWRALCDKPKSALKYIGKDAIISNKFLFGDIEVRSEDSDPPLEEAIKDCQEWLAYKMHNPQVVEIGLMAVAISYRLTLFGQVDQGQGQSGLETVSATCTSSWRQVASGDWELCSMFAS